MSLYTVIGTGISGVAAAGLLKEHGEEVILFDGNDKLDREAFFAANPFLSDTPLYIGELPEDVSERAETIVLSPGVPTDLPMINELRDRGKAIIGEIELAYRYEKGRIAAVTGTNGKTTTTALLGHLLKAGFDKVNIVGNIGVPYTKMVSDSTEDTVTAAEISSFQLETIDTFRPEVSVITNITPDHLDRHHTMEAYIAAKEEIAKNQDKNNHCILNFEDEVLRKFGESIRDRVRVTWFSSARKLRDGYYYEDGAIYKAEEGRSEKLIDVNKLKLPGLHNYENVMCAAAAAEYMGVSRDKIIATLPEFAPVEHRIEYVCEKKGVVYYNDSKGTNPDAAIRGIRAMDRPTLLIGGGYDKNSEYDEWVKEFDGRVKKLVLIGATAEKIGDCCKKHGFLDYEFAETFEEAMDRCIELAEPGDAVLLSPACASWGMFSNYEERGNIFKEYIKEHA
ncbi:MAG: UDP-N-acetylmuramoyl-L-alanine--D-glutamate ligase [Lachnospiraceae bacterium]|nr:UDP-N-acetylmuramoyl-L-alanine--D-glutamate ligase [Lachnospiraceae bacterium]